MNIILDDIDESLRLVTCKCNIGGSSILIKYEVQFTEDNKYEAVVFGKIHNITTMGKTITTKIRMLLKTIGLNEEDIIVQVGDLLIDKLVEKYGREE